jgi:hypothetical protein
MATAASTMSLLPLSQLKQLQQQRRHAGAGSVLVLGRRKRFVVPVRTCSIASMGARSAVGGSIG